MMSLSRRSQLPQERSVPDLSIVLEHVAYTYMPGTPFEQQALKDVSATIEQAP